MYDGKPCEKLTDAPEECSPEQIRECHGDVKEHACEAEGCQEPRRGTDGCEKPAEAVGKPEECSPQQIRKCHGDVEKHPCETDD